MPCGACRHFDKNRKNTHLLLWSSLRPLNTMKNGIVFRVIKEFPVFKNELTSG